MSRKKPVRRKLKNTKYSQENLELEKQEELCYKLEVIERLIDEGKYSEALDKIEDVLIVANRFNLNIIYKVAKGYQKFCKNPRKEEFIKIDIRKELDFLNKPKSDDQQKHEKENYKVVSVDQIVKEFEDIVKKFHANRSLTEIEENTLLEIVWLLIEGGSLTGITESEPISKLSKINFPNRFKLTEKLALLLEFFELVTEFKNLEVELALRPFFRRSVSIFSNIFYEVKRKYRDNFIALFKFINFRFHMVQEIVELMDMCVETYESDVLDIPPCDDPPSRKTIVEWSDVEYYFSKIHAWFAEDTIVVNFSAMDWFGVDDKSITLTKKEIIDDPQIYKNLKSIKIIGNGIYVHIQNEPVFNAFFNALRRQPGDLEFIIITQNLNIYFLPNNRYWMVNIKIPVRNFKKFKCQKEINVILYWRTIDSELKKYNYEIEEIEFNLNKIKNKKTITILLKRKTQENEIKFNISLWDNPVEKKFRSIEEYYFKQYEIEIRLDPSELLPIFQISNLRYFGLVTTKDQKGTPKFLIEARAPKCLMRTLIAEPTSEIVKFKEMFRNAFWTEDLRFLMHLIPYISNMELFFDDCIFSTCFVVQLHRGIKMEYIIESHISYELALDEN